MHRKSLKINIDASKDRAYHRLNPKQKNEKENANKGSHGLTEPLYVTLSNLSFSILKHLLDRSLQRKNFN